MDVLGGLPREGARAADTKRAQEVLVPVSLQHEEIVTHVQTVWEGLRRDRDAATWILAIAALGIARGQRHLCQVAKTAGITQGLSTVSSVSARRGRKGVHAEETRGTPCMKSSGSQPLPRNHMPVDTTVLSRV